MSEKTSKFKMFYWISTGLIIVSAVHYAVYAQQSNSVSTTEAELIMDDLKLNIQNKHKRPPLIREGTVFKNQQCEFRLSGNRVILLVDGGTQRFFCLENLNLERIIKVIQDNQFMNFWTADFLVTEYQKENYVLIQRAILNPSAQNRSKNSSAQNPEFE